MKREAETEFCGCGTAVEVHGVVDDRNGDDDPAVESIGCGAGMYQRDASGRACQDPVGVCDCCAVCWTPAFVGFA